MRKFLKLFFIFLRIGAFTFGGGYAMIPLIQDEIVNKQKWMGDEEILDIIAIAQSFPGALAINTSVFVGYRVMGLLGAILACIAMIIPSFFIIVVIVNLILQYGGNELMQKVFSGVRPAVVGLMIVSVFKLQKSVTKNTLNIMIFVGSFAAILLKVHPILVVISAGAIGFFIHRGE